MNAIDKNGSTPDLAELDEDFVFVRRHWNDFRIAKIKATDLTDIHWSSISGGVGSASPRPMVSGYMLCDRIVEGELAHSCQHGPGPHSIKVVVVKKDNTPKTVKRLRAVADDVEKRRKANHAPG
jgi:hypothetical protein